MIPKYKIILFALILSICTACGEEKLKNIYHNDVNFSINVRGVDNTLISYGRFKTFEEPRLAADRIGYGGLLVVCSADNIQGTQYYGLYVYDLACPKERTWNVRVKPNSENYTATCPQCGSVYSLFGGYVLSGPSDTNLQVYRARHQNSDPGIFQITR